MRPYISNNPFYRLAIPELSGGVNLRDGISLVADNQLTNCKNVWYKDGMLRTRPALEALRHAGTQVLAKFQGKTNTKVFFDNESVYTLNGNQYGVFCVCHSTTIKVFIFSMGKTFSFSEIANIDIRGTRLVVGGFDCNLFQHGNDIYCFCSGYYKPLEETVEDEENVEDEVKRETAEEKLTPFYIYKINKEKIAGTDVEKWVCNRITLEDIHVPTIAINGTGHSGKANATAGEILAGSTMLEGLNLLGNRYKVIYSTVDPNRLGEIITVGSSSQPAQYMTYQIPYVADSDNVKALIPKILKVTITYSGKSGVSSVTHTATKPTATGYEELILNEEGKETVAKDGLKMAVSFDNTTATISFYDKMSGNTSGTDEVKLLTESNYILNNMEIIAPCDNTKENVEKVMNMTCHKWYGGGSEGLYGGIHLFLGGNTKEEEKSLVAWSDFNKPLYFSENAYAYVGDKSQRVTAFGKQGEALIIAKEREMYATQYSSNGAMDAESVENQAIIDVAASEVTFPMVQVHGFIGCDCPHTMQLCRNRLVWTNSDGRVYTLVSASQYDERSIYEVSDMVHKELSAYSKETLKNARSADWEGHYVLFVGNKFYLMDYNSYGFQSVYSYTKNEDAQAKIPWWIWEAPKYLNALNMYCFGDNLFFPVIYDSAVEHTFLGMVKFNRDKTDDSKVYVGGTWGTPEVSEENKEIPTLLQTKFFDFGSPTIKKSVPKIEVSFGTNGGMPIKTTVLTENIADESEIIIDDPEEAEYSVGYFQNRLIRPANKHACRIGIRFESEGNMSVDAISLQYKLLGGLK